MLFRSLLGLLPQSVSSLLHGVILALTISNKLIQVLKVLNEELVGVWIVFNQEAKLTKCVCSSRYGFIPQVIEVMKCVLLVSIDIDLLFL